MIVVRPSAYNPPSSRYLPIISMFAVLDEGDLRISFFASLSKVFTK